jgi:hypothetical protein
MGGSGAGGGRGGEGAGGGRDGGAGAGQVPDADTADAPSADAPILDAEMFDSTSEQHDTDAHDGGTPDGGPSDGNGNEADLRQGRTGRIVRPWIDDSPGYARAVVLIGSCSGTLIDQDWVLTARRCQAQIGDPVVSVRPSGSVTTAVDRIDDNYASGDDSRYVHLSEPITDVPPVPLHWGSTGEIIGE